MTSHADELRYTGAQIAEALRWADARGLVDVGIHLNSALEALNAHPTATEAVILPDRWRS